MTENNSPDSNAKVAQALKSFSNLLKEFPKNPSEDFIYDGSTIDKITAAGEALPRLKKHFKKNKGEMVKILDALMEELPKDSSDEFLYDREIHHLVVKSRKIIQKLS
jgi:hypothetical protein